MDSHIETEILSINDQIILWQNELNTVKYII